MPNSKTTEKTNNKTDSQKVIPLKALAFQELWDAYPSDSIKHADPKSGKDVFSDHCAINVSAALYQCGVLLKSFKKTRCWCCPTPDPVSKKGIHIVRAQELSDYLETRPFAGCPKPLILTGANFKDNVEGKTGIIFFKDYWLRSGEKNATGDHIDLWKEGELAGSGAIASFLRLTLPGATEGVSGIFGDGSRITDLTKSKQVIFWEIA